MTDRTILSLPHLPRAPARQDGAGDQTAPGRRIPEIPAISGSIQKREDPAPGQGRRAFPAVWEARRELTRRGLVAIAVRTSGPALFDLIAWDDRIIYGIAVRRIRGDAGIRDITTRYADLIDALRAVPVPRVMEVQLWICTSGSFRVYRVLTGGLMARTMP